MALSSIDDKLLGEKVDNYCSSSEDEDENYKEIAKESQCGGNKSNLNNERNTGPKGVIEDWKSYRRNEYEKRLQDHKDKEKICQELSFTCNPDLDDTQDLDIEDKEFLEEYSRKRIAELQLKFDSQLSGTTFSKVIDLSVGNYVEEIETEKPFITILIHIYEDDIDACQALNGCFQILAKKHKHMKFCRIKASEAQVSLSFKNSGLPALLVYKNNLVIGNFVRVSDNLGDDFFASDVESFLNSYGLLPHSEQRFQ